VLVVSVNGDFSWFVVCVLMVAVVAMEVVVASLA